MSPKQLIKKVTPKGVLLAYHHALAWLAAWWYGHPSEKLIVIGITGTKGKSTTASMVAQLLELSGEKVGLTSTASMKIADHEWLTDLGMTMPGRFYLQKLSRRMVDAGCTYAVVETSSEGIAQHRHRGVHYDTALLTNLTPEHIEAHGSFEAYRAAKLELFHHLKRTPAKMINGTAIPKRVVLNPADEAYPFFSGVGAGDEWHFGVGEETSVTDRSLVASIVSLDEQGAMVKLGTHEFRSPFLFAFNVANLVRAIAVCVAHGVSLDKLVAAVPKLQQVPGRQEFINEGQSFQVMVDYTYEPYSLKALYEYLDVIPHGRIIQLLGATGGGRDTWRRPVLGEIAATHADVVIATTDDPYDEDPSVLCDDVLVGAKKVVDGGRTVELKKIVDRREAIHEAFAIAEPNDLVLITGRGAEQKMAVKNGKYIAWDDRDVARELLRALRNET